MSILRFALCSAIALAAVLQSLPAPCGETLQSWVMTDADRRGVLPNDATGPELRDLPIVLPPLSTEEEGTIRRVDGLEEKVAALTFDLCELATKTTGCDMETLDFLRRENIPATLFMGGKWMRTHASRVMQIMGEPLFEIASHAWTHGNFGIMDEFAMREQVEWTQAEYARLRGEALRLAAEGFAPQIPPVPVLFRLPYGRCSDSALKLLAGYGLTVIQWDVAAEMGKDNAMPQVAKSAASLIRPGSIVLMHANLVPKGTAALVRNLTAELRRQGYRFARVSDLLRMGKPLRVRDGYFNSPGDNLMLDSRFGMDGTGRKAPALR